MSRQTYLLMSEFERLEDWCQKVRVIFASPVFLVGSVLERPEYRDVDLRVIQDDSVFDVLYRGRPIVVRYLNRAMSIWGQQETGLPIDFQVQRRTEANAEYPGPRSSMGSRDWDDIPTSGVPSQAAAFPPEAEP